MLARHTNIHSTQVMTLLAIIKDCLSCLRFAGLCKVVYARQGNVKGSFGGRCHVRQECGFAILSLQSGPDRGILSFDN